jgi:hypothetical protein
LHGEAYWQYVLLLMSSIGNDTVSGRLYLQVSNRRRNWMKRIALIAGVATAIVAGAATANAANMPTANTNAPAYANPVIADADAMKAADQLHKTNLRQQLQDQLAKAGYTAVQVTPTSFFVQAKDKKGEAVAMIIGPDTFTEVTDILQKPANTKDQQAKNAATPMATPTTPKP